MTFDFIRNRKINYIISIILLVISLISLLFQGVNLGIDFTGGTVLRIEVAEQTDIANMRETLKNINHGDDQIQALEGNHYQIKTAYMEQSEQDEFLKELSGQMNGVKLVQGNSVGPSMGQEILNKGILALVIAIFLMIAYITFRFEWRFAVTGILALFHDIFITIGFFSLFQWEINSAFIAAILTIFGYSINDTIVVFDRIRENLGQVKKSDLPELVNYSISSTFRRSIYTSISTLIPLFAVIIFGGETTKMFTLAMAIGIIAGAYSSIFVAAPLWFDFANHSSKKRF